MTSIKARHLIKTLKAYRPYGIGEKAFLVIHPGRQFPYENTQPLPKEETVNESILKVDSRHMVTKSPNLEQLQALTFTPSRYWNEYRGKAKRDKYKDAFNDNVDRPGLT